jgi:membrane protein implicated in regulation of membrane protease activity
MLAFLKLYQFKQQSVEKTPTKSIGSIPLVPMELNLAEVERTVKRSRVGTIGRVVFQGVSWQAQCIQDCDYAPGTLVKVLYRRGNTLIVDAIPQSNVQQAA